MPRTRPAPAPIVDRVRRFVREGGSEEGFDGLVQDAFAFQIEHIAPIAALAHSRGTDPGAVRSWRDVPPVPALAYKALDLSPAGIDGIGSDGDEVEVFRSSGTTGGGPNGAGRSVHRHPFPDLYRTVIEASFPRYCLPAGPGRTPMLSLIPSREDAPDSSLSFMVDHVIGAFGHPESAYAFGKAGLDADAAGEIGDWCRAAERAGRPVLVLATAFALATWLDALAASGDRFRLPEGSVLFETGGFKGRTREIERGELLAQVDERLGVPAERVVREYGMTELTSQLYTDVLANPTGELDLFVAPPWVRVHVLDPETGHEAADGEPGLVTIFDLANLSSAIHVMTEDLGRMEKVAGSEHGRRGLRLLGRAAGAELRGCSLTAEEMIVR